MTLIMIAKKGRKRERKRNASKREVLYQCRDLTICLPTTKQKEKRFKKKKRIKKEKKENNHRTRQKLQ